MTRQLPAAAFRIAYQLLARLQPHRAAAYTPPAPPGAPAAPSTAPTEHPAPIPRKIWSYWHAVEPDPFVQQCIANWQTQCPDFEVQVLNQQTVRDHVPPTDWPEGFSALNPVKQSDWIRLYLVSRYGGYWLDASVVLTQPLDWLEARQGAEHSEFVGFYLGGYTHDARYPVIENWAFGAPAGGAFVTAWQREFHHALFEIGTQAYLASLQREPGYAALLQGITDPVYLLGHVTAQRVLRRHPNSRLTLSKAEDTAFFYQKAVSWKWYLLYPRLCLVAADPHMAPLVKLRGGERRHFAELMAQHGAPAPHSLWGKACQAAAPLPPAARPAAPH